MTLQYFPDIGVARYSEEGVPFYVSTLLQNTEKRMPGITAYTFARLSRSPDPLCDILKQVMTGADPLERLNNIFHGYGHASVGDMANLSVFLHGIPAYYSIRIFNMLYVLGAQERSTRYQNFSNPEYVGLPQIKDPNIHHLQKRFNEIIEYQYASYRDLLGPTQKALSEYFDVAIDHPQLKRRAFDTVRYVLPLAHGTSLGIVMSARQWSYLIAVFAGSPDVIENDIARLLMHLLGDYPNDLGYKPEAGALIRHTTPVSSALREMRSIVMDHVCPSPDTQEMRLTSYTSPEESLVKAIARLIHPREYIFAMLSESDYQDLGEALFRSHHQYNPLGNSAQTGHLSMEFYADLGVLKDLNRHRSSERWFPLLTPDIDVEKEIVGDFSLCPYLELDSTQIQDLRNRYHDRIGAVYTDIQKWMGDTDSPQSAQYAKMLLPYAHRSYARMGLSVDDLQYLINLRIRPGGHIAYRLVMQEVLDLAAARSHLWRPLSSKTPKVDIADRSQFMNGN